MLPISNRRRFLGLGLGCLAAAVIAPGCGSSLPADGTHLDLTVPKEQAAKQADAYKGYSKQGPGGPGGGGPSQRNRNRR